MNNVDFESHADDNIQYVIGDGVIQVIEYLKEASDELFCWLANNQMKVNSDKCHLITNSIDKVGICFESICFESNNIKIENVINICPLKRQ